LLPIQATIEFTDKKNIVLIGGLKSINPIAKHDETFDCDIKLFNNAAEFRQKVKVIGKPITLTGILEGQVCSDIDGKCIQISQDFSFNDIIVTGSKKKVR